MTITAYPLTWPQGFNRTTHREAGAFKTSLPNALKNVQSSVRLFAQDSRRKLENFTISSNVTLGAEKPADPGVAVWFVWDGLQVCIAVDRYSKVESNLQAIHHIIEARRVELRHGTLALVRATFTGLLALPLLPGESWKEVLMVPDDAKPDDVKYAHKRLSSKYHPDNKDTGDEAQFDRVQKAWKQYQSEQRA